MQACVDGLDGMLNARMTNRLVASMKQKTLWPLRLFTYALGRVASDSRFRYPEIGYFGHEVFVQKYVLGFQVTMNDAAVARVQKIHAFSDLWAWSVDNSDIERELTKTFEA